MKTTAILALAGVAAANTQQDLLDQKAYILRRLDYIDTALGATASTSTSSSSTTSAPAASTSTSSSSTPATSTTTTPAATTTTKPAESSNTGIIVGSVVGAVVLIGVGVWFYKKKQGDGEKNEGGEFTKLV